MNRDAIQQLTQQVTEALANINEAITTPAIEATMGYRQSLEQAGFSPTIAEQMAVHYHTELIKVLFSSITGGKKK